MYIEVSRSAGIYRVMGSLGVIQYRRVYCLFGINLWFEYGSRTAELVGGKGVDCLWNWERARIR